MDRGGFSEFEKGANLTCTCLRLLRACPTGSTLLHLCKISACASLNDVLTQTALISQTLF